MKTVLFTILVIGISATCSAQQKQDNTKSKIVPSLITKDAKTKAKSKPVAKLTPPLIVKDKPSKIRKHSKKSEAKFIPPVIVKDPAEE